ELGWSYPISEHVRFYTQVFSGYGESLIDYNHRQTRVGVGVTLNDLF
ncbi:MAG: phospholipase A, partial [Mixta calida]|nr:phospholipase A [Mixta calida]